MHALDEQKSVRFRQRLWGAAVLIALLVIFLPLLLDGSGSESQYRRVESLRAEPPRIINANGVPEPYVEAPDRSRNSPDQLEIEPEWTELTESGIAAQTDSTNPIDPIDPDDSIDSIDSIEQTIADGTVSQSGAANESRRQASQAAEALSAWVVQAGSFGDEENALAVRDKLRRAGFPSFVTPTDAVTPLYRVLVGPMIDMKRAEASRAKVVRLLGREAIVVGYP